jgi:hypothetical protein
MYEKYFNNKNNGIKIILIILLILFLYMFIVYIYFCSLINYNNNDTEYFENYKNWNELVSGCYYINLERSKDRKKYMEDILKKSDIDCERFQAIEGKDYLYLCPKLKISKGALGCKLSHLELLKKVKKTGWTIIFEDDIYFKNNIKQNIVQILNKVPNDAELVLFGTSPRSVLLNLFLFKFEKYKKNIWKTKTNLTCAHAYAINYSGAQKWIKNIEEQLCDTPFDMHSKGIDTIYFSNDFCNASNFFKIFWEDWSLIRQNKTEFGYFNSLINF